MGVGRYFGRVKLPKKLSLVTQTAEVLREEILSGKTGKFLPGEMELCEKLHVSRVTLRAALKGLSRTGLIRSQQGRRHELVRTKRRAAGSTSRQVILLSPSPLHTLSPNALFWIDALREFLTDEGWYLDIRINQQIYRAGAEKKLEMLAGQIHASCWVLYKSSESLQRWFSNRNLPCVIIGSKHEDISLPSVDIAYRAVCRHAVGQFLARGHQRIVLMNPTSGLSGDFESERGCLEAVNQSVYKDIQFEVVRHNGTAAGVCEQLDKLLHQTKVPSAFLVSRPEHVLTAVSHLLRRGRWPQEAALISRDDAPFLEHVVPAIARYGFAPKLFAKKVSKAVLDMAVGGRLQPGDHLITPHFISGQTLG